MFNSDNLSIVLYKQEVILQEKPQMKINSLKKHKHTLLDKSFKCTIVNVIFYKGSLEITLTVPLMVTIRRISVRKVNTENNKDIDNIRIDTLCIYLLSMNLLIRISSFCVTVSQRKS